MELFVFFFSLTNSEHFEILNTLLLAQCTGSEFMQRGGLACQPDGAVSFPTEVTARSGKMENNAKRGEKREVRQSLCAVVSGFTE